MKAEAYARATDPRTSWEAAESLTEDTVRASQRLVLNYVRSVGRAFIKEVEDALHIPGVKGRSYPRLRSACSELRDLGLLEIAGYARPPWAARDAMILKLTPLAEAGSPPRPTSEGNQTSD